MGVQGDVLRHAHIVIQPFVTKMYHILTQPALNVYGLMRNALQYGGRTHKFLQEGHEAVLGHDGGKTIVLQACTPSLSIARAALHARARTYKSQGCIEAAQFTCHHA